MRGATSAALAKGKMKTFSAKKHQVERRFYLVDATDKVLGRTATRIAQVLMGKHKPIFTPHVDTGDFVVVVNAEKIKMTGRKDENKKYWKHTGYAGGIRSVLAQELREKKPEVIVQEAVRGMLPKGPLGRQMFRKLKVYAGPTHPHAAQKPEPLQ